MIIATTRNDTLLLKLLLDSMSVKSTAQDLPDGSSVQLPDLGDCLDLYSELGCGDFVLTAGTGGISEKLKWDPSQTNPPYEVSDRSAWYPRWLGVTSAPAAGVRGRPRFGKRYFISRESSAKTAAARAARSTLSAGPRVVSAVILGAGSSVRRRGSSRISFPFRNGHSAISALVNDDFGRLRTRVRCVKRTAK